MDKELKHLGHKSEVPDAPSIDTLDTFPAPSVSSVRFITHEFTSMCPKTGQPDFATIMIEYQPRKLCVESKSLKLYLQSYRNSREFIEKLTEKIYFDLDNVLHPNSLRVQIISVPRGGLELTALKASGGKNA